jgi:hypothetical protein
VLFYAAAGALGLLSALFFLRLIALWVLGGATIEGFALALVVGVATGSYSSIFTASPFVCSWYHVSERRQAGAADRSRRPAAGAGAGADAVAEVASVGAEDRDEEEGRPSARATMEEAERAAQEEKRRKRRERRKKRKDDEQDRGRQPKKRF